MPKVVLVLADGFEEVEAMSIIDVLRRAELDTVIAGLHDGPIISTRKVKVLPDMVIDMVKVDDFDMIVLPGGQPGADNMHADERVIQLIKKFAQQNKLIGAICAAPIVLAKAGVLQGKHVTSFPSYRDRFESSLYEEKTVVEDGNILTSRGPGTALAFALAIVERLVGKEKAQKIKAAMLIEP
jgi:4-methyl-5(b-hydroxyethyl)-thiazole monophosphate biosynthesis